MLSLINRYVYTTQKATTQTFLTMCAKEGHKWFGDEKANDEKMLELMRKLDTTVGLVYDGDGSEPAIMYNLDLNVIEENNMQPIQLDELMQLSVQDLHDAMKKRTQHVPMSPREIEMAELERIRLRIFENFEVDYFAFSAKGYLIISKTKLHKTQNSWKNSRDSQRIIPMFKHNFDYAEYWEESLQSLLPQLEDGRVYVCEEKGDNPDMVIGEYNERLDAIVSSKNGLEPEVITYLEHLRNCTFTPLIWDTSEEIIG